MFFFFFFFSSRRRHTRSKRDWSSDVCSSDLIRAPGASSTRIPKLRLLVTRSFSTRAPAALAIRSEERRVGKDGRSRWSPEHEKKRKQRENEGGRGQTQRSDSVDN